jgi:hypothetical protein
MSNEGWTKVGPKSNGHLMEMQNGKTTQRKTAQRKTTFERKSVDGRKSMDGYSWMDGGPTDVLGWTKIGDAMLEVTTPQNACELCGDGRQQRGVTTLRALQAPGTASSRH